MQLTEEQVKAKLLEMSTTALEIGKELAEILPDADALMKLYDKTLLLEGSIWSLADDIAP